jgi:hypothetical protein
MSDTEAGVSAAAKDGNEIETPQTEARAVTDAPVQSETAAAGDRAADRGRGGGRNRAVVIPARRTDPLLRHARAAVGRRYPVQPAKSIEFPVYAIAIGLIGHTSVAPAQGGAAETGSARASSAHKKLMIRSRHWMSKVTENGLGVTASTVVSNRRIVMELGAEAVRSRRRARKLLIAVGDVVGVLVLIGAVFVLGSHGGALEALLSFKIH